MPVAAGERFGAIEIVSRIGAGGMGEVYRGHDTSLGRDVAIKILPPELMADPDRRARFEREARVLASLNHPNIATIYGVEERDGVRALVMELVEGDTLASRLAGGRALPVAEAIELAIQSATALSAAHAAQIVHRDFKPANVMVRRDGYVKVLDFGLATAPAGGGDSLTATLDLGQTRPGTVMGTLQYMAPEQARGIAADQRADIFSLGAVLYEMIAGAAPFRGASPHEMAAAILHEEPPSLTRLPGVSPALDRIVTKMLRKDREQRYQDIRDVIVDLKELRAPVPAGRTRWVALAAAIVSVVAGIAYVAYQRAPAAAAIDAMAVLPFSYSGPSGDVEYLADGLTESLISDLSQGTSLRVMSRSSSFRFKGRTADAQAAGQELNVDAVLSGRIEPRGDRLAISVELIAIADGRQLWGHQYSETSSDVLQLQRTVSRDVVQALQERSAGHDARAVQPVTSDAEAYRLYLQGRYLWKQLTEAEINRAIAVYLQAVQRDPGFAQAYVGLAESYIFLGTDSVPPREALPKATAYATKALSLKPDLADAHVALGIIKLVYDWDWRGAEQELRGLDIASSPTVESFSCALHYKDPLGRNSEALAALQSALGVDPLSLPVNVELGCASYYGRRFDQAIRQFKGTLTLYPNHPFATYELGRALSQKHEYAEAIATLRHVEASSGEWAPILAEMAYANALAGNRGEAERLLGELLAQRSKRFIDPYLVAGVYVALGQTDRAFAALNDAVTERSSWLPWLKVEPKWDPLRADRRYPDLMRRVGLPL